MTNAVWGVAEDGSLVRINEPPDGTFAWWPTLGLSRANAFDADHEPTEFAWKAGDPHCLRLESDLSLFVTERLASFVAVHAAVIRVDGTVIVVPGTSHSGKSTLCKAALDAGHTVLSDEYALIVPEDGTVRGWVRPIRIRQSDGSITRLDVVRDHDAVPVDLVASIDFSGSDDDPLVVRPLTGGEVAMELLANTVCAQSRPEFALRGTAALARSTRGVAGTRGNATAALIELVELAISL